MMLAHLVDDLSIFVETTSTRMQASELVSLVKAQGVSMVCLADLPPSPPSKTRYLVKRLHAELPDVLIVVGRWGPPALADESTQLLSDAGAALVASTLAETRTYLGGLAEIARIPAPEVSGMLIDIGRLADWWIERICQRRLMGRFMHRVIRASSLLN